MVFWQVIAKKESNMGWMDKVLNVLYLVVIVSGSAVTVMLYEEWKKKR
jgi:hypothetical protein